jgi:choline dehydrogenase-like flavoprotein
MISDIREALEHGADAEFDVVVVGAGPAGITVAREIASAGRRVALLEAGGMEHPDQPQLALYDGETTGLDYPLIASRQRYFGGTSNHWGGWCRPLDPIDFAEREWMPGSGWPISHETLDPWYQAAHGALAIPSNRYDMAQWAEPTAMLPSSRDDDFYNAGFRFSPPLRYRQAYADELEQHPTIHVFLNATMAGLDHDGETVKAVRVRTLDGHDYRIKGGQFVLAAGGLELPRLLLHTASGDQPALGNRHGHLGRYFMEHFGYTPGFVLTRAELKYYRYQGKDGPLMPVLAPSRALMENEKLNNCCMRLTAVEPDTTWPSAAIATPGLARNLETLPWRYRVTMINEPSPNPDSRITLSEQPDALGMQRIRLHWSIVERDLQSVERLVAALSRWLGRSGLGRVQFTRPISPETTQRFSGGMHHMGTTRMSRRPEDGVVNTDCRVHETRNLYVASSSVFPTVGYANPTLTIVALALRLADHLKRGTA